MLATVVVAVLHLADWAQVDHVAGAWIALTKHAADGRFYPSLYDGTHWGGTRFMPLSIAWNLLFATMSGGFLIGTKLAGLIATIFTLAMAYVVMRRLQCPRSLAVALLGTILLSRPGFMAATHPFRGDVLPVGLQLAAILLVNKARPRRTESAVWAGLLCVAAVLFKVTAGWACIAIGLTLLFRDRRALVAFCGTFFIGLGVSLAAVNMLTDGRFLENLLAVSASGLSGGGGGLLGSPGKLNFLLMTEAVGIWFLGAFVVFQVLWDLANARITIYQLAFLGGVAILVIVLSDPGALTNHLIDVTVLVAIGVADLMGRAVRRAEQPLVVRPLMTVALLWSMAAGFDAYALDSLKRTIKGEPFPSEVAIRFVRPFIHPDDRLLSEHPALPVVLQGRAPVILDAYMVARIGETRPTLIDPLAEQIRDHRFDKVILLADPKLRVQWYSTTHFGERLIRLIVENYREEARGEGYFVYVPRGRSS